MSRLQHYPYIGRQNTSPGLVLPPAAVGIHAVMRVNYFSERNIMRHIKVQPISITLYWGPAIQNFHGPVFLEFNMALTDQRAHLH